MSIQNFLSGLNDDQQRTSWPGAQKASTCSKMKRQVTRIEAISRWLVKVLYPPRSDKFPNGSGLTNFVTLKKRLVIRTLFKAGPLEGMLVIFGPREFLHFCLKALGKI